MLDAALIRGFSGGFLSPRYDQPKPIPKFHEQMWEACCSEDAFVAIAAPRAHAKSTSGTHAYLLCGLLSREWQYAFILSCTESQAVEFLGDIKMELLENDSLREAYGVKKLLKEAETDLICLMDDGYQFRVRARGIGPTGIRGRKWRGKRPQIVIMDDVEDEEAVDNKDRREKFKGWVDGAVAFGLSDNGKIRAFGTVLHYDSWLESVMPDPKDPNTIVEPLMISGRSQDGGWRSIKFKAHPSPSDFSQILWPEKRSAEWLKRERDRYAKKGQLDVYCRELLNEPIDDSDSYFSRDDIQDFPRDKEDKPILPRLAYYASCDGAFSKESRRDYTVNTAVGVDEDHNIYVLYVRRERVETDEGIATMFSIQKRFNPELYVIEKGSYEKSIAPAMRLEQMRTGRFINLEPITVSKDKTANARSFQARTRAGAVYFDKKAEWYPDLEQELLRFPKGTYDDQVDTLALIGRILDTIIEAPTDEEQAEIEYEEEMSVFFDPEPRSRVCGF